MPLSHCSADCCNVLQCVVTCCHEDPAEKKVFIPFRKCRHPVQLLFGALNVTIGSTGSTVTVLKQPSVTISGQGMFQGYKRILVGEARDQQVVLLCIWYRLVVLQ